MLLYFGEYKCLNTKLSKNKYSKIKEIEMTGKLYTKPKDLEKKISDWAEPSFSEAGISILNLRYLTKDESGKVIETPKEMLYRVAHVVGQMKMI